MKPIIMICFFLVSSIFSLVQAYEQWDLPGIDIITREERGADETRKHKDSGWYNWYIKNNEQFESWENGDIVDVSGAFAGREARELTRMKQRSFMIDNFPDEYAADETIEEEDGHPLRRPIDRKQEKTKIIIHHTASNGQHESQQAVLSGLQYIYKLHAHQNGRGDIGYNFLIDRFGNIYEGRAGGPGAVGAHASWNNVKSIGITLFGNFNVEHPSQEMINSLVKLTTMLALKYDIEPHKEQYYFTPLETEPYMEVHKHESIVGHKDTKNTACPGVHLYEMLPDIKQRVVQYLNFFEEQGIASLDDVQVKQIEQPVYIEGEVSEIVINLPVKRDVSCLSVEEHVTVTSCERDGSSLKVTLQYAGYPASGLFTLGVKQGEDSILVDVPLVRQKDIERYLVDGKNQYLVKNGLPSIANTSEKVKDKLKKEDIADLMREDVHVLLYELTEGFDRWDMTCEGGCDVILDNQTTIDDARIIHVVEDKETDSLDVFIDLRKYEASSVRLKNPGGIVEFGNYDRVVNGIPYNIYRGDIRIQKESYRHLDYGRLDRYIVVNDVPLQEYMEGIGESSERQHEEKIKTLAMLVKNYALFYLKGANPHPSIPDEASYNAVDDPRIFQKYVGAGYALYGKKRLEAVRETKDLVILYEGYIPILPYFHCSAGFTWSGREKRGRTDTPWLKSVVDFESCPAGDFAGHGVGLSGNGAQRLALKGANFEEILKWYYSGIEIESIDN